MPHLQSRTIEAISYDDREHILEAKFRTDGKVTVYANVPQEIYDSLIFADSITEFFETHIAGIYPEREGFIADDRAEWPSSRAASHSRSRATFSSRAR